MRLRSTSGVVKDDGAWLPMAEGMWGQRDGGLGQEPRTQERKEMAAAGGGVVSRALRHVGGEVTVATWHRMQPLRTQVFFFLPILFSYLSRVSFLTHLLCVQVFRKLLSFLWHILRIRLYMLCLYCIFRICLVSLLGGVYSGQFCLMFSTAVYV